MMLVLKFLIGAAFPGHAAGMMRAVQNGWGWQSALPIALQVLAVFVITDVIQYWLHRAVASPAAVGLSTPFTTAR